MWKGVLVVTRPLNGCTPIDPPPPLSPMFDINITKSIALIRRYDCNFDLKVSSCCFWLLTCIIPAFSQWSNCVVFRFCMHSKQDTALQSFTTCIQTFCSTWTTAMVHLLHLFVHYQALRVKHSCHPFQSYFVVSLLFRNYCKRNYDPLCIHQLLCCSES